MQNCIVAGGKVFGPPASWDQTLDGPCHAVVALPHVDTLSGAPFLFVFFKPSEAELKAMMDGGVIRVGIQSTVMPVMNINTLSAATCQVSGIEPVPFLVNCGDDPL